jgi:hypothetical protein
VIEGSLQLGDEALATGDAARIEEEPALALHANAASELIMVEVPAQYRPVGVWAR